MNEKSKGYKMLETDYLGPSDIVSHAGGQYVIKEKEMESALDEIYKDIGYDEKEVKKGKE